MAHAGGSSMVSVRGVGRVATHGLAWRSRGQLHVTVIAKASFALVDGGPMTRLDPTPVRTADEHHDRDPARSLRFPAEDAPHLPRCDVVLVGHVAPAPGATRAQVRLVVDRAGEPLIDKALYVVGARTDWYGTPAPLARVPVEYERAYGGPQVAANPVGTGGEGRPTLPSVVHPRHAQQPAGFAALAPTWSTRRRHLTAGPPEMDGTLLRVPDAFDWRYLQAAPEDQRTAYLSGHERILVEGMGAGTVTTLLPGATAGARVWALGAAGDDPGHALTLALDMLVIDADAARCDVVWRASSPIASPEALAGMVIAAGVDSPGEPIDWSRARAVRARPSVRTSSLPAVTPKTGAHAPWERSGARAHAVPPPSAEFDEPADVGHTGIIDARVLERARGTGDTATPPWLRAFTTPARGVEGKAGPTGESGPTGEPAEPGAASEPDEPDDFDLDDSDRTSNYIPPSFDAAPFRVAAAGERRSAPGGSIPDAPWVRDGTPAPRPVPQRHVMGTLDLEVVDEEPIEVRAAGPWSAPAPSPLPPPRTPAPRPAGPAPVEMPPAAPPPGSHLRMAVEARLLRGEPFDAIDLSGADLSSLDLRDQSFVDATLTDANLRDCRLDRADLGYAALLRADMRGASLVEARLVGARLDEARLVGAELRGADLSEASLDGADLTDASLVDACLRDAAVEGARVKPAQLAAAAVSPDGRPRS